jgi:sugar lactone lactonase YvrE
MAVQKQFIVILVLLLSVSLNAQNFEDSWNQHFSYLDIKAFSQSETKVYAAAENAIFSYDKFSNQIATISTIQGLSGDNITTIKYVSSKNKLYIGYDTGLIQIYDEINNSTFSVVDILDKPTISADRKQINDFNLLEDRIYISADFGVSVFFIESEEFGDTYYLGTGNTQIAVNQTAIFDEYIYAATENNIKRAELINPNLIDETQWQNGVAGNWTNIITVGQNLYASSVSSVYRVNDLSVIIQEVYSEAVNELSTLNNKLSVATNQRVKVYTEDFLLTAEFLSSNYNSTVFSVSITSQDNDVYIGTSPISSSGKESYGVLKSNIMDVQFFEKIHPESPLLNRFFKIETQAGHIWGTHGGHSLSYSFGGGKRRAGISHLINEEWKNIVYDSLNAQVSQPNFLSYISINPFNSNRIMLSSYWFGVLEIEGVEVVEKYNNQNSTLSPLFSTVHLALASAYDSDGAYWVMDGRVDESLNRFQNNEWTGISLANIISPPNSNLGFGEIAFDNSGNLFIGSHGYGLISYKEGNEENTFNNIVGTENNMPSNSVRTVKVDQSNQVWFGTSKGLRVVYNPEEFINGNTIAEEIIILDNGEASELLFDQYISDIEVDGSNNKWISSLDNGVFYLSSDGQRTIYHFTKDNSPLPSNDVLDVAIDDANGRVYIATEKGLVSFASQTSKPQETLEEAYIYPNPVRPGFNIVDEKVKIVGLTDNMNIKITDIEGNLVTEAETKRNGRFKNFNLEVDGGTALWNGKNLAGKVVASGVYVVLLNDLTTFETKVLKIMLIR